MLKEIIENKLTREELEEIRKNELTRTEIHEITKNKISCSSERFEEILKKIVKMSFEKMFNGKKEEEEIIKKEIKKDIKNAEKDGAFLIDYSQICNWLNPKQFCFEFGVVPKNKNIQKKLQYYNKNFNY